MAGLGLAESACNPLSSPEDRELARLNWQAYFQKNFRLMSDAEKEETVARLERLHQLRTGRRIEIEAGGPLPGVLYGYAFNVSKCQGYMDCVRACIRENNQDRRSGMAYIRIHEHQNGQLNSTSNPAPKVSFITFYASGLGVTDPLISSGSATPTAPLLYTFYPVAAYVGDAQARVTFAGLAPGLVGVYQVNAQLPLSIPSGTHELIIVAINGVTSQINATIATAVREQKMSAREASATIARDLEQLAREASYTGTTRS